MRIEHAPRLACHRSVQDVDRLRHVADFMPPAVEHAVQGVDSVLLNTRHCGLLGWIEKFVEACHADPLRWVEEWEEWAEEWVEWVERLLSGSSMPTIVQHCTPGGEV